MKDIDRFQRDAENHKKEIEKLKKELEKYQKRDWLQGEEIIALKRLTNVSLNDELVRKKSYLLPVRFHNKTTGNFINIERFLSVNNFFGHFTESVNI